MGYKKWIINSKEIVLVYENKILRKNGFCTIALLHISIADVQARTIPCHPVLQDLEHIFLDP